MFPKLYRRSDALAMFPKLQLAPRSEVATRAMKRSGNSYQKRCGPGRRPLHLLFFFPARVPRTKKKNMFLVVVFHDVPTHRGRPLKLFFLSPLTSTCPMARAHIGKRKIKMGKGGMRRLLLNIVGIGLRVVVDLLRATQLRQVVDLLRATRRRRRFRSSIEEAMRWR